MSEFESGKILIIVSTIALENKELNLPVFPTKVNIIQVMPLFYI